MKKFTLQRLAAMVMVLTAALFTGCKDDDATYDAPYLEIDGGETITVSYDTNSVSFDIKSNRDWNITLDTNSSTETWFALNPDNGSNNGTVTIDLTTNTGSLRTAVFKIRTSTVSTYLTLRQAGESGQTEFTTIYEENMGSTTVSANTAVAEYTGFQRGGTGGSSATYAGEGTSPTVRYSASVASSGYTTASGGNNVWIPAGGSNVLIIDNIATGGEGAVKLSFGRTFYIYGATDDPWTSDDLNDNYLIVYLIRDGVVAEKLSYTGSTSIDWQLNTSEAFDLTGATTFGLKFANVNSAGGIRIDDVLVQTTDEVPAAIPNVTTTAAASADIADNTATLKGSYTYTGTSTISEAGIAYKVSTAATYTNVAMASVPASDIEVSLSGLSAGTTYDYYAYVIADGVEYKGTALQFTTTGTLVIPTITTFADDFQSITGNYTIYSGTNWTFTSTDTNWPGNVNYGWHGRVYDDTDKYMSIAPYSSSLSTVTAYAALTTFDMASVPAANKALTFDYAYYYQAEDATVFELVVSTDYAGSVEGATWTRVENLTLSSANSDAMNTWFSKTVDLSSYSGNTTVAFRYVGKGVTYRLDNVAFNATIVTAPTVTSATTPTTIASDQATITGTFVTGTETISEAGIAYSTDGTTYTNVPMSSVPTDGNISVTITGLTASTIYYYYAYVITPTDTYKGSAYQFTTIASGGTPETAFSATWNMQGRTEWAVDNNDMAPTTTVPSSGSAVTYTDLIMTNPAKSGTVGANTWGGTGWDVNNTDPLNPGRYASFTFTATKVMSIDEIKLSLRMTQHGPFYTSVQYSLDSGSSFTEVGLFSMGTRPTATTSYGYTEDLSSVSALQNIASGTTVIIRLVPYGTNVSPNSTNETTQANGSWYISNNNPLSGYSGENLVISGTYTD